jgi:pyruvate dehydrogenase (quinone)
VLALSGDMPRKMHGIDYFQSTRPDLLFRDVSLYTQTIMSPEQAPAVIHQAIAAAYAGRGVAHLTLPQDVISGRTDGGVASVDTLQPRPEFAASAEDVARIASRINAGDSVLIMCGNGCHGATAELQALSDHPKAFFGMVLMHVAAALVRRDGVFDAMAPVPIHQEVALATVASHPG